MNVEKIYDIKDIKAVFLDIDGTFFDHISERVLPESIQAVKALQQHGYKVCLCSGRAKEMAEQLHVLQMFPWDGYVGGAGVRVYNKEMQIIYENAFSYEQARQIFEIGNKHEICIYSHGDHEFMTRPLNTYAKATFDEFHCQIPKVAVWRGETIIALNAFEKKDYDWHIFDAVEGIHIYKSCDTCVDIMKQDSNKAQGIHQLMKYWGYPSQAYIAFGDSMNDIEMLQDAHVGIAMGNANDIVKAYADKIIGYSDTPAIYQALKDLKLIS